MDEAVFTTSGSTGKPVRIVRSMDEMRADAASLAKSFGGSLGRAEFFAASIREEHFYGAVWLGLLPSVLGLRVSSPTVVSVEDLLSLAGKGRFAFITTPSFLEKAVHHPEFPELKGSVSDVVVSGGALRGETSARVLEILGVSPLEIYGTTEAGTIAWRRRAESEFFRLMDGVRGAADADGRLTIESPFAMESPLVVRDEVRFVSPCEFELLGRTDRFAKVLESFVSLSAVERALESHGFVSAARAEAISIDGVQRIGALVVLSEEGRAALAGGTFAATASRIRRDTVAATGNLAFPRRLRFVSEMPSDSRGKTTAAAVKEALAANCREPVVVSWSATAKSLDAELVFPPDGEWFSGHFPGFPILPGVAQVFFLRHFAIRAFGSFPGAALYRNVKFKRPIRPGERVKLKIERNSECDISFEYSVAGKPASSGTVRPR